MKKILSLTIIALLCNVAFAQADTTAIFYKADSLNNIADSLLDIEKYNEALSLYNEVATLIKDAVGENNEKYAQAIDNISNAYYNMDDTQNALKYCIQESEIIKNIYGEGHQTYIELLDNIGKLYYFMADYQNALAYFGKAKEIVKRTLGEEHPKYAVSLNNLGIVYDEIGDTKNALENYMQALEIWGKTVGKEHPQYAKFLNNIGVVYKDLGDYQNALKYYILAMEIDKKILGEEHPGYAKNLNNIGIVYQDLGDYQKALEYYTQAMNIWGNTLGKEHYQYSISMNNMGSLYHDIGELDKSLKYYEKAMNIQIKTLGKEHPEYAQTLNNIGNVYADMNDFQNSLKYHTEAAEIRKVTLGEEHPVYAISLDNIGTVYNVMGDYPNALEYYIMAEKILSKTLGENHPQYATSMNNIGTVYLDMNDYQNALKYYTKAAEIQKNTLGEEHLYYALSLNGIGRTHFKNKDYLNAMINNALATDIRKMNLIRNFSFMTSHEREAYWNTNNVYFSNNIKCTYNIPHDTLATKTSYDTELITKGLLLASEISLTNTIMESGDTALISEYETLKKVHLQLNNELEKPISERVYNCDSLENEIQKMERQIMEKSKEFGDITHFIKIDWKEVQNSLKQNDVAIEFSNFTDDDTTRYVALVLTKNMDAPVCVPLFTKNDIGKMLRGIAPAKTESTTDDENRGATTVAAKRQGIYESTSLYNALWKPLEKYFPENPRIYFAPSGDLHQIAVEYAPTGNGKTISDKYEIYRVSSTRFLAMNYMPKPLKSSVLYGGIYYDSDTTTMKQESDRYSTRSATSYTSFADFNRNEDRGSLNYLPGTKTEVEDIVGKLKKKRIKSQLYEGSQANEESFKALSGSNISVLHIATHGFFLPTDEKMSGDQSLIQSGLLLSGANYAWQNKPLPDGIEDGILTAKEISFMDLRKTDLVVLSACQTALGEITGEGVFGLQRGFKKAGARTIIMSLWPVDDNATLLMMTEFYNNLTKGMTKREAFLAAQNKVKTTAGFENPRYWAAFIMLDGNEK